MLWSWGFSWHDISHPASRALLPTQPISFKNSGMDNIAVSPNGMYSNQGISVGLSENMKLWLDMPNYSDPNYPWQPYIPGVTNDSPEEFCWIMSHLFGYEAYQMATNLHLSGSWSQPYWTSPICWSKSWWYVKKSDLSFPGFPNPLLHSHHHQVLIFSRPKHMQELSKLPSIKPN